MAADYTVAFIGLLGVVVGSLATVATQVVQARQTRDQDLRRLCADLLEDSFVIRSVLTQLTLFALESKIRPEPEFFKTATDTLTRSQQRAIRTAQFIQITAQERTAKLAVKLFNACMEAANTANRVAHQIERPNEGKAAEEFSNIDVAREALLTHLRPS